MDIAEVADAIRGGFTLLWCDLDCRFGGGASGASAVAVRLDPRAGGGTSTDQVPSIVSLALTTDIDDEDSAVGAVALLNTSKKRIPAANF